MGAPGTAFFAAALCLCVASAPRAGTPEAAAGFMIRAYNQYGLSGGELRLAGATLQQIFHHAGRGVDWQDCSSTAARRSGRCEQALEWNELVVRIVARPQAEKDALGQSLRGGSLATVFGDSIRDVAGTSPVETGTIAGRVMAHEVGHLLLTANRHSPDGLMRTAFTPTEIANRRPADWLFSASDASAMKESLAVRHQRGSIVELRRPRAAGSGK